MIHHTRNMKPDIFHREDHLQKKIDTIALVAKEKLEKNDKKGALFCLKRKKMYEGEKKKIVDVKLTLETQVMNLESAAQDADTLNAMKVGTNMMKEMKNNFGIDEVDDIMDDIKGQRDEVNVICDAMAQPIDGLYDEDELLAELAELEKLGMKEQLLSTPSMPSVPGKKLPTLDGTSKAEEEELKKLVSEVA